MDELQYVWTGAYPDNRAPQITAYTLDGQTRYDSPFVVPGERITFQADITDPEGERLRYEWELLPESTDIRAGGDAEARPDAVPIRPVREADGTLVIRAPRAPGAYRMFVYAYDAHGNVATANMPFYAGQFTP